MNRYHGGDSNEDGSYSSRHDCYSSNKMWLDSGQNSVRTSKMYINPHFNQAKTHSKSYLNPNFYPDLYKNEGITQPEGVNTVSKIHVNPKFVNVNKLQNDLVKQREVRVAVVATTPLSSAALDPPKAVTSICATTSATSHSSHSKYKLIRNNKPMDLQSTLATFTNAPNKSTINISKYKTISLQKLQLETIPAVNEPAISDKSNARSAFKWIAKDKNSTSKIMDRRKYKLVAKNLQIPKVVHMNKSTSSLISIRGGMFAVTDKTLKLVGAKPDTSITNYIGKVKLRINGKTYIQKSQYLFVRRYAQVDKEKLKKNNIPCPLFRRYGKCVKKEKGKCSLLHDTKHVAICRQFLKGQCDSDHCSLSHEVSAKKMPTCSFYLQGCCVRESCPYLHVKVSDSADLCSDFLNGYCLQGNKCTKRHEYVCPEFEKHGKCAKSKCPYPHRKGKEQIKKIKLLHIKPKTLNVGKKIKTPNTEIDHEKMDGKADNKRYFVRGESVEEQRDSSEIHTSRVRLGTLPSYIQL